MDEALERGTVIAGRYVVDEVIARTASSVVYRVEHVHTGERLAMKVLGGRARLDPRALQRFKREARTSSRIRSEHVVLVTDADTAPELDGAPFIVMELLIGENLETFATRHGPLAPAVVVPILAQVAAALEQAHRLQIVHRDLKPENLFLHARHGGTTIAKVLDFGISKFVSTETGDGAIAVTSTGAVLGTPLYMAPEQAEGKNGEIEPATDVWAMALIAVRLLAGEHYWGRPTMAELIVKLTTAPIVAPSVRWPTSTFVSSSIDAWFLRSCDRDRRKRWASVGEQMAALATALDVPLPASGEPPGINLAAPDADAKRSPRARALAFAVLVLVSGAVAVLCTRGKQWAAPPVTADTPAQASQSAVPLPQASIVTAVAEPSEIATTASTSERPAQVKPSDGTTTRATPRTASPPAVSALASASAAVVDSIAACGDGEVRSFGHCCPLGHAWQSGRCARPVATSF